MIQVGQSLLDTFTSIEIQYPEGHGAAAGAQRDYQPINNRVTYRLKDREARADAAAGPLSLLGIRQAGALALGYNRDRYATDIRVDGEGLARFCVVLTTSGALQMRLGGQQPAVGDRSHGLIYDGRQQRQFETWDDTARVMLWIEAARMERALVGLLDEPLHVPLAFASHIDWSLGRLPALRRTIAYFVSELGDPMGMTGVPAALESFTDGLVHLMLNALPHSHAARLDRAVAAPAPAHLRRALAFMHASSDQAVTIADVAAAAGCGTRTLLNAFRRFRDTTPLAAFHDIRLQHARAALLASDGTDSTRAIARRFGFTNPSRFAVAYGRRFGETPAETRRE
ncbi:AraC-like DNA-binding protein [Stella humosa]|uniref:AraC-like DNA-binding protein n=1 Tax=Stella humosa TaxID=94 RepID=A0A3N1MEE0_9PROT|nr:AraC family transcriptional regulator [Stella humosa]ROP99535.1 AraC-like DNA-binding protein [Stella humosa]BBK31251.1 hypothetical protein STHU_18850 [Stella humosa]